MFGQYSQGSCRRTKADMLEAAAGQPITWSRKAGHNRLHFKTQDGAEHFMLHLTVVATLSSDKAHLTLNDGGWATVTTRSAMGDATQAFGLGHLSVWGDKGGHSVNGQHFDRTATFEVPGFKMLGSTPDDIMVRAVVNGETSLEVRWASGVVTSNDGAKVNASPARVTFEIEKLLDLARRHRGFVGMNQRYGDAVDYSEAVSLFGGAYDGHAGRFGRSVHIGCHEFKCADIRAALRRFQEAHPAEAKAGHKLFLSYARNRKEASKAA